MNNNVTEIILLAGNSTRYGKNINKNFELIEVRYLFLYSLNVFNENININDIIKIPR